MANNQGQLPSGSGGFMRYSEQVKGGIELTPQAVAIACGVVIAFELFLRFFYHA